MIIKNMGSLDRILRLLLAISVGVLYATGYISGLVALVLGAFAAIFLLTSCSGFCPLYKPFRLTTYKR